MDITCDRCQSTLRIQDEKIPEGRAASLLCPKCKNRLSVSRVKNKDDNSQVFGEGDFAFDEEDSEAYDASEKPFDFVEEEGKTALICESDPDIKKKITTVLDYMEYHITECERARDALKKMRYHLYDVVIVNEDFDTIDPDSNSILIYLQRLEMDFRRNVFVAVISRRFRTMDHMMAFNKSVDLLVNTKNINDFEKILGRGITDKDLFYRLYHESLRRTGRI